MLKFTGTVSSRLKSAGGRGTGEARRTMAITSSSRAGTPEDFASDDRPDIAPRIDRETHPGDPLVAAFSGGGRIALAAFEMRHQTRLPFRRRQHFACDPVLVWLAAATGAALALTCAAAARRRRRFRWGLAGLLLGFLRRVGHVLQRRALAGQEHLGGGHFRFNGFFHRLRDRPARVVSSRLPAAPSRVRAR